MNFDAYLEDKFFIIDSTNLENIEEKLYGYALSDYEIIDNQSIKGDTSLGPDGAYIFVKVNEDEIKITQDFNGSYGLYLFKYEDYFAISNSFQKLVDYLKYTHELSLNKDYADAFLYASLVSFAYSDTLVNEINLIPRNYIISIDKKNKTFDFSEIDYHENTISIDSKEGIQLLDTWYYKWIGFFRNLRKRTNNISFDLSGGFDSRIIACIWLTANIDLNNIRIKSKEILKEDFDIASDIAEFFNFKLNLNFFDYQEYKFDDINTSLKYLFPVRLGFNKQMYFKSFIYSKTFYSITGAGGEAMRGYPNASPKQYLNGIKTKLNNRNPELFESSKRILLKSMDNISKKFNIDKNSKELIQTHYKEVRNRSHFGKSLVSDFLVNIYSFTPLNDPLLRRLNLKTTNCNDANFLFALIFTRYCPDLLNFKFEGEREFNQKTLDYASIINEKYPFVKKDLSHISGPDIKIPKINDTKELININDFEDFLTNVFLSKSFKLEFNKYFTEYDYNFIVDEFLNKDFKNPNQKLSNLYAALSIVKFGSDCHFSQINKKDDDWLNQFNINEKANRNSIYLNKDNLIIYNSSLIQFNTLNGNPLEFIGDDDIINKISSQEPQNIRGKLYVIKSHDNFLELKIKCSENDTLFIRLKGPYVLDNLGNKFPVYIDYTKFELNGENIIDNNTLLSCDDFFQYSKNVEEGEIIHLKISWLPFNKDSVYKQSVMIKKSNINKNHMNNLKNNFKKILKRF